MANAIGRYSSELERLRRAADEKQAIIELYGRLLAELFPGVRASGPPLVHAQQCVEQIRALARAMPLQQLESVHPHERELEPVRAKDLQRGDRVWCRAWAHPMLVVLRDEDERGLWYKVRRWDGLVLPGRFRFDDTFRSIGQLYRLNPVATCPRCGRGGCR